MLRILARILGFLALGGGMAAGIYDGAKSIADGGIALTPLGTTGFWLFPRQFPAIEPAVTRHIHPLLWDPLLLNFLMLPTVIVLFAGGTALLLAGRTAETPITAPE
jgi:hypothetical protein